MLEGRCFIPRKEGGMKRLLQVNVTANWGSTGKIAEQIGVCAMARGWKSYVAYGRMMNPSKSELIKIGTTLDVYEHYAENRLLDKEGLASRRATKAFLKKIDEIQPDVVHLHNIHDHYLNYQILFEYLNKTGVKVVWTFHDCWAFTGNCYHFVWQNCMKWQKECHDCVSRNRFVDRSYDNYRLKERLFAGCNNLIIVPCSYWMGNFVRHSFLKDKPMQVIHNGIDLNIFKPMQETAKNDGKFRIIAVSNVWLPYKGLNDIFKLRVMLPDDFEIVMVGLAERQMNTLPAGIRGIQRTQSIQELVTLYNEADVLVNPTYADTFPTVNLEALACGTPVITYRTGGSPEAVDEKTGVVVEQGNVDALADAIVHMREHPLSSTDCRKRAELCFDKDRCFGEYVHLYERLLE